MLKPALYEDFSAGTHAMAHVYVDFDRMVEVLGKPIMAGAPDDKFCDDDGKVTCYWIRKGDGFEIAAWDYKSDCAPFDNTRWSLWSNDEAFLAAFISILGDQGR